jgi:hypothetical protein
MLFSCEISSLTQALGGPMSIRDYATHLKPAALAAALAVSAVGAASAADMPVKAPAPAPAPFFLVNDNSVTFTWYPSATDPGVSGGSNISPGGFIGEGNTFSKWVGSATHFDVWAYGTDFFNIDYIKSSNKDPIQGIAGATGASEVYGFARSTLGFNEILGTKMFSTFLTKDVSFVWGGDANTENNFLAPEVRKIDLGIQFMFNLPGTVALNVNVQKEWNHNTFMASDQTFLGGAPGIFTFLGSCGLPGGTCFTGDREFKWVPRLELGIIEPLTFIPWVPLTWLNFTNITFPKGTGISTANLVAGGCTLGPGSGPFTANNCSDFTKVEVWEDNRISLDASKLWWGKAGVWDIFAGYRYWYNKFGTDHNAPVFSIAAPGTSVESTAYVGTTYHFK